MTSGLRARTVAMLIVAGALAAPAVVLRVACVGAACAEPARAVGADLPFCSLPEELRGALARGYREGRSPDVYAIGSTVPVSGATAYDDGELVPPWPADRAHADRAVPVVFAGAGVDASAAVPPGTRIDRIAPTIASIMGLDRPHPEVRSGEELGGVASGERPRLVLQVALKGLGSEDLRGAPALAALRAEGTGTMDGDVGSLPLDPAAQLATIGTGGMPHQHGTTGALLKGDEGSVTRAWSPEAPGSVIAALGDDVLEHGERPARVGLVAHHRSDQGLVGGGWYPGAELSAFEIAPTAPVRAARSLLESGFGSGDHADLLGVVLTGTPQRADARLGVLIEAARAAADGSVAVVVTATGPARAAEGGLDHSEIVERIERRLGLESLVTATAPGGLFVDQEVLAAAELPEEDVVAALRDLEAEGDPLFADAFTGIAVTFARYC